MKLRNKKTGEIREVKNILIDGMFSVSSLAEFNEEWEDYEEPKTFWAISWAGEPEEYDAKKTPEELKNMAKEIGNYFETREEAEKAVRELKAWERLKEKGFEFEKWCTWEKVTGLACFDKGVARSYYAGFTFRNEDRLEKDEQVKADLGLLFGGEE